MSTKKDRIRFIKDVKSFLVKIGAVKREERWELHTKYGLLILHVDENHYKKSIGTVFTRFDNPPKEVDCNHYSGKWNHYYFDCEGWNTESATENFMFQILSVMPDWVKQERYELVPNYNLTL